MDFELPKWAQVIFYLLLASFGGLLGYITKQFNAKEPVSWSYAMVQSAGAGFVGFLMYQLCMILGLSQQWTGIVVGVFGWLGASASIEILRKVVFKRMGVE